MAHDVRLAYVLVGDEPPGSTRVEHEGQHRYTQANLKAALQCMGCKPRLAHKASKSFFLSLLSHLQTLEQGGGPPTQPQATLETRGTLNPKEALASTVTWNPRATLGTRGTLNPKETLDPRGTLHPKATPDRKGTLHCLAPPDPHGTGYPTASCGDSKRPSAGFQGFHRQPLDPQQHSTETSRNTHNALESNSARDTGEGNQPGAQARRGWGVSPTGLGEARGGDVGHWARIGVGGAEARDGEAAPSWKSPGSCSGAEAAPVQKSYGTRGQADVATAWKPPGSCRGAAAGSDGGSCQPRGLMGNPAQDRQPSGCTSQPQNVTEGSEYAAFQQQRRDLPNLDMPAHRPPPPDPPDAALPDQAVHAAFPDQAIFAALPDQAIYAGLPDQAIHTALPDQAIYAAFPDQARYAALPDQATYAALPDQAISMYMGHAPYPHASLPASGPAGIDKSAPYAHVNHPREAHVGLGMSCPADRVRVGHEPDGGDEVGGHMGYSGGYNTTTNTGSTWRLDAHGSHGDDVAANGAVAAHVTAHVTVGVAGDRKPGAEGEEGKEAEVQRVGQDAMLGAARCAEGGEGVESRPERMDMEVEPATGSHKGAARGAEGGEGVESRLQRLGMKAEPATGSHMVGGGKGTEGAEGREGVGSRLQRLGMRVQPAPGGRVVVAMRRAQFEDLVMDHVACHTDKYLLKADFQVACSVREQRRSVCVMLCGTSGTGKSTLAGLLAARLGITAVVSTDSIRHMLRSFMPREKCPVLWASTYEAAACVPDPSGGPPSEESGAGSTRDPKQRIIAGYKAQSEMVVEKLSALIEGYERRRESVVCEGVHLSLDMVVSLMERHPSTIPFLIIISNEAKHRERFAVRAKYMTMEPKQNRYVAHLRNIRVIQDYLMRKAEKHAIPTVNNTNVDRSLATIHGTVVACLRRMAKGERLLKPGTRLALPVAADYALCKSTTWSSKNTLRVIMQRRGGLNISGISPPDTPSTSTSSSYAHLSMFADTDDGIDARSFQESDLASGAGSESGSGSDVEDPGAALEERLEGGSVGGESDADEHEDEDLLPFTL